nr:alkaline phosphatase PhoX [Hydrococcus rivularis]
MALSRRNFLTLAGAGAATFALASLLRNYYVRATTGQSLLAKGFGELIPDPNGILDLPKGFQYRILSQTGKLMSDGNPVPTSHDGMAAFPGKNGATILVRNHELDPGQTPAVMTENTNKYDRRSSGGTTTLIVDKDRQTIKEFVSLAGTNRNCSGGATPWGSWISCEEDDLAPQFYDLSNSATESIKHGYNFEVFANGKIADPFLLSQWDVFDTKRSQSIQKRAIFIKPKIEKIAVFIAFVLSKMVT